ncbi:MAG TPA: ATP-binding protein [Vicinamibacterales bacterium]|nr:ATP-binding protein [Vicinamibacterales bacterium]
MKLSRRESIFGHWWRNESLRGKGSLVIAVPTLALFAVIASNIALDRKEDRLAGAELREAHRRHTGVLVAGLSVGVVGGMAAAWLFFSGVVARVKELETVASELAAGRPLPAARLASGQDEIGRLDAALRRAARWLAVKDRELRDIVGELESLNTELEAFSYSVSHDLRAPLRAIAGFAQALDEEARDRLSPEERRYLDRIRAGAGRMGELIDDLLQLSRVTRVSMHRTPIDLAPIARSIAGHLDGSETDRTVQWQIPESLVVNADEALMRIVLENLLGNAFKFTARTPHARIRLYEDAAALERTYVVDDNGAGFDMARAAKLFGVFQRLHSETDFAGTGIGLATVQRIVHRHGGTVSGESTPGGGARFRFTLGVQDRTPSGEEMTDVG